MSEPRRPRPLDLLRTLLALAVIPLGLAVGLATGLVTRSRRRAVNRTVAFWGDAGLRAAGLRLEVRGREHLGRRPAVFLMNHQSGIDTILLCALLRRDFVGVAKQEIRRNPLLGPAFAFAGVVFVDRIDSQRAIAALEPAVEVLRAGTSIAIAPEGTRSAGPRLGPFRKGGFRLAMAAGVPLVPIVLEDAWRAMPRGAWLMRGGRVRVTVLPPIPTREWRLEDLAAHIAEVRGRFLDALGQTEPRA